MKLGKRILAAAARVWEPFKVTVMLLTVLALFTTICLWFDADGDYYAAVALALLTGASFSLAAAQAADKHRGPEAASAVLGVIGLMTSLFLPNESAWEAALILAALLLSVHFACQRGSEASDLGHIADSLLSAFSIGTILFFGLTLCVEAFWFLFLSWLDMDVNLRLVGTLAILCHMLIAPCLFMSELPRRSEYAQRSSGAVKLTIHLLLPIFLLLMAVLLVYVLRILVLWEMPVGTMNYFALTALAFYTFFRLTLTGDEGKLSDWFIRWGGWLMLPVLIAQQVGVWIRVSAYGLTTARIWGIALTVLMAGVVLWSLLRKRSGWFFPAAALMVIILLASPVKAQHVAQWNQELRLYDALERNGMLTSEGISPNANIPAQDKAIILSAYEYLDRHLNEQFAVFAHIEDYLQQEPESLFGFSTAHPEAAENAEISRLYTGSVTRYELDVDGYRHAKWYSYGDYNPATAVTAPYIKVEDQIYRLDSIIDSAVDGHLTEDEVQLTDGRVLCIAQINYDITGSSGQIDDIYVTGWLLTPAE